MNLFLQVPIVIFFVLIVQSLLVIYIKVEVILHIWVKLRDLDSELAEGHRASEWESPFWIQALCL